MVSDRASSRDRGPRAGRRTRSLSEDGSRYIRSSKGSWDRPCKHHTSRRRSIDAHTGSERDAFSVGMQAQSEKPVTVTPQPAKAAYYVDSAVLDVGVFLPEPPAADSAATHARVRSRPSVTTASSHVQEPPFLALEQ